MTYRELNNQVIQELRKLGIWYAKDSRLPLFWLRRHVPEGLVKSLDALVAERIKGQESYN